MGRRSSPALVLLLAVALATAAVYWPVTRHGFVYDDVQYVTGNENVRGGLAPAGAAWAFTTMHAANWHPLTWLSHQLDVELYGLDPAGHHLTSLLLHVLNGALLFLLFRGMTGSVWRSAAVAGLFLLHPLRVESVAWVSERKDVLSTGLGLLTLLAYLRCARRGGRGNYLSLVALYALGLMAKPMLVSLPLLLLLLDYWPLRRTGMGWRRSLLEKAPLAVLAALSCWLTYVAQAGGGAVQTFEKYPFLARLGNAVLASGHYLWNWLWPSGLAVYYPHPGRQLPPWEVGGAAAVLLGVTAAAAWCRKQPYVAVGWLWYLATLLPVIGLVQVGSHAMADRYTYLPLVGILAAAVWWSSDTAAAVPRGTLILAIPTCAAIIALGAATRAQVGHWRNDVSLFEHALRVTPVNWFVHSNLAGAYSQEGRPDRAMHHYREAAELNPGLRAEAFFQAGEELFSGWRIKEAVAPYREALRLNPEHVDALLKLGVASAMLGQKDEALASYRVLEKLDRDKAGELLRYLGEVPRR